MIGAALQAVVGRIEQIDLDDIGLDLAEILNGLIDNNCGDQAVHVYGTLGLLEHADQMLREAVSNLQLIVTSTA